MKPEDQIEKLTATIAEMRSVLKKTEWSQIIDGFESCFTCKGIMPHHEPMCFYLRMREGTDQVGIGWLNPERTSHLMITLADCLDALATRSGSEIVSENSKAALEAAKEWTRKGRED